MAGGSAAGPHQQLAIDDGAGTTAAFLILAVIGILLAALLGELRNSSGGRTAPAPNAEQLLE
eukprot:SAG22_NODE_2255_length_2781_cov_2.237882_2_plen_62_part_00